MRIQIQCPNDSLRLHGISYTHLFKFPVLSSHSELLVSNQLPDFVSERQQNPIDWRQETRRNSEIQEAASNFHHRRRERKRTSKEMIREKRVQAKKVSEMNAVAAKNTARNGRKEEQLTSLTKQEEAGAQVNESIDFFYDDCFLSFARSPLSSSSRSMRVNLSHGLRIRWTGKTGMFKG